MSVTSFGVDFSANEVEFSVIIMTNPEFKVLKENESDEHLTVIVVVGENDVTVSDERNVEEKKNEFMLPKKNMTLLLSI